MLENRHRTANPSTVRKLAAALGVSPETLIDWGAEAAPEAGKAAA